MRHRATVGCDKLAGSAASSMQIMTASAGTPQCGCPWFSSGVIRHLVCLRSPALLFKMDNDSRRAGHTLRSSERCRDGLAFVQRDLESIADLPHSVAVPLWLATAEVVPNSHDALLARAHAQPCRHALLATGRDPVTSLARKSVNAASREREGVAGNTRTISVSRGRESGSNFEAASRARLEPRESCLRA